MGYTVVKSFERGLDTRRLMECIDAGFLLDAKDCHVTRGGEIEKRAAFVVEATLPATTFGFFANLGPDGTLFHTFGDATTAPAGMPANGVYHSIPHPEGNALTAIMKVEDFMGKLYVVAQYDGGHLLHWWGDAKDADGQPTPPLMDLITEYSPGPGTIIDDDGTVTPTPAPPPVVPGAKPEVSIAYWPTKTAADPHTFYQAGLESPNTGSGVTVYPISAPYNGSNQVEVPYGDGSGNNTAAVIAEAVNSYDSTGSPVDVIAQASGNVVRFVVNEATPFYNGWKVQIVAAATAAAKPGAGRPTSMIAESDRALSGGKDPVIPPAGLRGVFNRAHPFAEGDPAPKVLGTFALAHNQKMYTVNEQLLNFSMVNDASRWDSGTAFGAGSIDHTSMAEGHPVLVSMADFGGDLAVFGSRHIFIWKTDPLPESYFKKQVLHRTGTIAPHSVKAFGSGDVMYLDKSGIRSLASHAAIDAAYASDFGIMIDRIVREKVAALTIEEHFHNIWSEVEPTSGRLWMALKDTIFVLSYYPAERISAWTYYDATGVQVDMMNSTADQIFWRSGNNVVSFGGTDGAVYDATEALARLPYIDGGRPATSKNWTAVDAAIYGTWQVRASFDPTMPTAFDLIANVTKSTYQQQKIAMNGESPAVSLELRTSFVGPARVGNAALHYEQSTAD